MIQPEAYYAAHKNCHTPEELGRLGFIIVGRGDELSPSPTSLELSFAETLMECNQWHNEKRKAIQEKERKRKAKYRETKQNGDGCPVLSPGQLGTDGCPTHLPNYLPNYLSTNLSNKTNTNRTDTEPIRLAKAASGSDRVKIDPYSMGGEEFFSAKWSTLQLCNAALGRGFWAKAIRQLGDAKVLEELWAFISEVRAGEVPDNIAATMTKRLKELGVK